MRKIHVNNDDNYATPPELYNELDNRFNFDFDPCPYNEGKIINDGLEVEWGESNFVNPPYSLRENVIEHLYFLEKPFALLINESGLFDSKKRYEMLKNNPFEIMIFDKRIDYIKPNTEMKGVPFKSIYLCSNILEDKITFDRL